MTENGGGKEAVDISGRGVMWTEWEDISLGYTRSSGGPAVSCLGRAGGVGPAAALSLVTCSVGTHPVFPSWYFLWGLDTWVLYPQHQVLPTFSLFLLTLCRP